MSDFDVDPQGNCIKCGGIHFGTGKVCVFSPEYKPAPKWPEMPKERDAKDYAIEYGGYLADAAQAYLEERNRYDMAVAGYGDEVPNVDSLTDHHQSLRSRIYEFRKRAAKASQPAPTEEK